MKQRDNKLRRGPSLCSLSGTAFCARRRRSLDSEMRAAISAGERSQTERAASRPLKTRIATSLRKENFVGWATASYCPTRADLQRTVGLRLCFILPCGSTSEASQLDIETVLQSVPSRGVINRDGRMSNGAKKCHDSLKGLGAASETPQWL